MKFFYGLIFFSFQLFAHDTDEASSGSGAQRIGLYFKEILSKSSDAVLEEEVDKHLKVMRLKNEEGGWNDPYLSEVELDKFPSPTIAQAKTLIDEMIANADRNPFLQQVIAQTETGSVRNFFSQETPHNPKAALDLIGYALILENITKAMRHDIDFLKATVRIWDRELAKGIPWNFSNLLFLVKYYSIRAPLLNFIKSQAAGRINPNFGQFFLPLNILEATAYDWWQGNKENAYAGWILAHFFPGRPHNPTTGEGPTILSRDGNATQFCPPFPKEWADLYSVWNLAFVSQLNRFPIWATKLLIPQVSVYHDNPCEYIHNRMLALYVTLNHQLYAKDQVLPTYHSLLDTRKITKAFSIQNAKSAVRYFKLLLRRA
jgi:hypothetical protein